jgi:hypothetical protein
VSQRVGGNRCVQVLDPATQLFKARLDSAKCIRYFIRPWRTRQLGPQELESLLKHLAAPRDRQTLDSVNDLGQDRLRYGDIRPGHAAEPGDDARVAPHERGHGVGIQDVGHSRTGRFDRRARATCAMVSSNAAAASGSMV